MDGDDHLYSRPNSQLYLDAHFHIHALYIRHCNRFCKYWFIQFHHIHGKCLYYFFCHQNDYFFWNGNGNKLSDRVTNRNIHKHDHIH